MKDKWQYIQLDCSYDNIVTKNQKNELISIVCTLDRNANNKMDGINDRNEEVDIQYNRIIVSFKTTTNHVLVLKNIYFLLIDANYKQKGTVAMAAYIQNNDGIDTSMVKYVSCTFDALGNVITKIVINEQFVM